ncbi:MAG: carboxylating nicotinate-nucleotide diphosphorylase [Nitrososphaeria archaeon]
MITTFDMLLDEDAVFGDITSETIIPEGLDAESKVIAKEEGIVAGLNYLKENVEKIGLKVTLLKRDGDSVKRGDSVAVIEGNARKLLLIERVFLNILGRMSGIATATKRLVDRVKRVNPNVRIAATRKTLLGKLDKIAVTIGGGDPHRWSLSDHILIKDNHIALVGLEEAIKKARRSSFVRKIEVEVERVEDAFKAVDLGADIIMFDNFKPNQISEVVKLFEARGLRDRVLLEASGGISEENISDYAESGVDVISIGALTHSTRSLDFSIDTTPKRN